MKTSRGGRVAPPGSDRSIALGEAVGASDATILIGAGNAENRAVIALAIL